MVLFKVYFKKSEINAYKGFVSESIEMELQFILLICKKITHFFEISI